MNARGSSPTANPALDSFESGGEVGGLISAHNWQATALGPPETWPRSLRSALQLILKAGHPMSIWWGPDLTCFYNDAYRELIGAERHPTSLGQSAREVWEEAWNIVGPQIEHVLAGSGPTRPENARLTITRSGRREDVHWIYSFSPIAEESALKGIGGVLMVCTETTEHVSAARRAGEERERLRESEARFREIADAAPLLIWISDVTKTCTWFNEPWLRFTGRAMEQETGYGWVTGVHPDDIDRCVAVYNDAFDRQESYRTQYRRKRRDGEWRMLNATGVPRFAGGAFVGYIGSCYDVTDQIVAARALSESEEQLRLATEAAEVGLWDWDMVNDTVYWPPRVKAMFGISPEVPISTTDFFAGLHPEDRERIIAAFNAACDPTERALYDVEYRTVGKEDRIVRWVAAKGRAVFDGDRCVRVIGTAIDITARKAAEQQLRELNESLEQRVADALAERKILVDIVESTDALIQVLDLDFRIMAINRARANEFERRYGVRPKVGDNLLDLLEDRPERREVVKEHWSRALAGEEFTAIDEFVDPNLDRRYFEIRFNALRDRHGELVGAFQFVYDVTDRLRDQARLAEAESHIRQAQKIEALGQLTGGVAHDFNNLLMVITGGLSLLERQSDSQRRLRVIDGMRRAAERGASLSRQLLAFSRRQPLKSEPVDLRRQIDSMQKLLDRTLRGDVHVTTALAEDLWPIKVDPAELELVILNLCVNARDAMPGGGVITISARNVSEVRQGELSGDFVLVTVADTGTGMSAEVLSHVFEPFFTTKDVGKGSGLGLPQVYGFAQQSGGSVRVSSAEGLGTIVTLMLPRTHESPALSESHPLDFDCSAKRRAPSGSILLVEDDDEVAALVIEMLQELGYRITRTASAQGALGALADDRPVDLVFSDIIMPGSMNGLDLAREVKRRRPGVPVLLTSGYAGAAYRNAEAENIPVLRKPYEIDALDTALRAAIETSAA